MAFWNRDIDRCVKAQVVLEFAQHTATPLEEAEKTTLSWYEGRLYEGSPPTGSLPLILQYGIYHRIRRLYGVQYCSLCLANDQEPYFRKRWRLAFITTCPEHKVLLHDKCIHCESPIMYHRLPLKYPSIGYCHSCGFDLREAPLVSPDNPNITHEQVKLLNALDDKWIDISGYGTVYSILYFRLLRALITMLGSRSPAYKKFQEIVSNCLGFDVNVLLSNQSLEIEKTPAPVRHCRVNAALWALNEWPERFVSICSSAKLWSAFLTRGMQIVPYWYWIIINSRLNKQMRIISPEEIKAAVKYAKSHNKPLSKAKLRLMLGAHPSRSGKSPDKYDLSQTL